MFLDNLVGMSIIYGLIIFVYLLLAAIFDYKNLRIPNKLQITFLIVRGLMMFFGYEINKENIIGAIVGFLIVFIPAFIMNSPMGGDIKLVSILGLYLGIEKLLILIGITLVIGIPIMIYSRINKDKNEEKMYPFAVILFVGYLVFCLIRIFV